MAHGQLSQDRGDAVPAEHERRADPQASLGFAAAAVEFGFAKLQFGQGADAAVVVGLAVVGQALLAGRAVEQPDAQARLQPREPICPPRTA